VAAGYDDVWGVELSPYAAKLATRVPGVKVLTGDLLELDLPPASFDVINATEVIEHLRDPLASFRRIKELLAPGGVFIYSTGNAKGLYARVLGRRWPYLHPEGHLFYYTPETLGRYFEKVGLTPLSLERMGKPARTAFLSAEDQMAHSMLLYIGGSDRGMKGRIFRTVGALENPIIQRLVTTVVGKHRLPIAINGAAPTT
jgi:SAM-dependent methyltransferase